MLTKKMRLTKPKIHPYPSPRNVREAGGSATEISGASLEFRDREDALFSNGVLHKELVKVLNG